MYDEEFVKPIREELTSLGVKELKTSKDIDGVLGKKKGSVLAVVNSVCGCAGGIFRPGIAMALKHNKLPDQITSVFAGVDMEATERVRQYFVGYPPSSPSVALMKNVKLVFMLERKDIERETPEITHENLIKAFEKYC